MECDKYRPDLIIGRVGPTRRFIEQKIDGDCPLFYEVLDPSVNRPAARCVTQLALVPDLPALEHSP